MGQIYAHPINEKGEIILTRGVGTTDRVGQMPSGMFQSTDGRLSFVEDGAFFQNGYWQLDDFNTALFSNVLAINGGSTKSFTTENTAGIHGVTGSSTAAAAALSGQSRFFQSASSQMTQELVAGSKYIARILVPTFTTPANMGYSHRLGWLDITPSATDCVNGVYLKVQDDLATLVVRNNNVDTVSNVFTISRDVWYSIVIEIKASSVVCKIYNLSGDVAATLTLAAPAIAAVKYGCQMVFIGTTVPTGVQELVRYDYFGQFVKRSGVIPV